MQRLATDPPQGCGLSWGLQTPGIAFWSPDRMLLDKPTGDCTGHRDRQWT
jgi:hypothetical protein